MAIDKDKRLLHLFHQLPEPDQNSTLDFMEYLAQRKKQEAHEEWEADNSPLTEDEAQAIKQAELDIANHELLDWEDIKRDLHL
ncbi:hypothetical protein [Cohnella fermenti]|uniref:DUF2281 domain-containing protein n=1 Tax=Cohnella fermenti TaxID=2565925 RepID=A0A4S4C8M9_9BACL|nr:hypothetical protein [Cohnella fermenti]THF83710.1 hypothetical protein E6C55_03190 [Cohnella fermenti]